MTNKEITLEKEIRFSQSILWHDQKKYYDKKGIAAWDEDVPFYITSNPFIAKQYAHIAIGFIQDWLQKNPNAKNDPFTFLELGAGTGQFSFYFLKNLITFQKILQLDHIKIRYIMSDVTSTPFEFWKTHHALKPFVDSGVLEFMEYDLYHANNRLKTNNPLIIIANYLFDSISTDVFTVNDGKLYESLVTLKTDASNSDNNHIIDWTKVDISYTEKLIQEKYYHNEFDSILFDYPKNLIDTHFQFPIAGLAALKNLQALCNNQFLLITSDKGYTNLEELDHCEHPELDHHGSFSVMVNYHAIGEYLKQSGGEHIIQAFRENIVTGVFSSGFPLSTSPQLNLATKQMIQGFSPTDYFLIYEHFIAHYKTCSLEIMSSYLNLSGWDPYVFDHIAEFLCDLADEGDPEVMSYLSEHMHLIADNFYFLPTSEDTLFNIGLFFQNAGQFDHAITYYQQSEKYFGQSDVVLFNMAMCLHSQEKNSEAIEQLQKALVLNADAEDAKEWIKVIQSEQ